MKPILISGSLVYDRIMNYPGYFKDHIRAGGGDDRVLNLSFVVDRLVATRGGTAGNIAHTVKLLGGTPVVVGALGTDGADYLAHFARRKIETTYIARDAKYNTASAHIITDKEDNQITGFFTGTPPEKTPGVAKAVKAKNATIATISPTHASVMKRHLRECAKLGMTVMFDPGQQINALTPNDLRMMSAGADIVIGNDYEIKILQEKTGRPALPSAPQNIPNEVSKIPTANFKVFSGTFAKGARNANPAAHTIITAAIAAIDARPIL